MEAPHTSTPPLPYRSPPFHSFWVLSCTLIENSKSFPEISLLIIVHGGRVMETLIFSHLVRSMSDLRPLGWLLKRGQSRSLNLWHRPKLHRFCVRSQLTVVLPVGVGNQMVLVQKPCIPLQGKTQTHLPLWFEGSHEAWGEVSRESRTLHRTQKHLPVICIFKFLEESGSVSNGMWPHSILSWPYHPHDCVLGQVICSFLIWTGKHVTWVLWTDDDSCM